MFNKLIAFVDDNATQIDAGEGEAKLKKDCPRLQDGEQVLFAFKDRGGAGRDDSYFTSQRVLIRDVKGISGKSVKYQSIPYQTIKAFSVETPGSLDADQTLKIWSSGLGKTKFDFMPKADIFAIARFFNQMVFVEGSIGANVVGGAQATMTPGAPDGKVGGLLNLLGGDATQIDAGQVQAQLKKDPNILMDDETIEMAFKCGRDSFLLTSKRVLQIDVQGLSGKKVEYLSILWRNIKAFELETAGSWDRDAEMTLFTNIPDLSRIDQDFRKGKCDVMAIQKFFADKLLGMDSVAAAEGTPSLQGVPDSGSGSLFAWMGDDSRMIDATEVDKQYHSNPPVLQPSERVEMAFKGRRDLVLFTTKRLLIVDVKGWSGKKVKYVTVPWKNVQAYGVRSAGSWMDKDSEMMIWTDIDDVYYPPKQGDNPPPPPIPRMSFLEMDFQKDKVDLMAVQRYLSARCLHVRQGGYLPPEVPVSQQVMAASPPGAVENFLNWIGDDARTIDAGEVDAKLHTENPVLQEDENVVMAFKSGRDMLVLTTKRVLLIDVQGFTGKKVEWTSVPYTSIRAFAVESAGSWDRDVEIKLYAKTYWIDGAPGSKIKQDLRKGRADIVAVQSFLAAQILDEAQAANNVLAPPVIVHGADAGAPGGIEGFLAWIGDDAHQINTEAVDQTLHESPPILQKSERAEVCYKVGRDMIIFTTMRVILVDVQGWSGKRVEYLSFPLRHCAAFAVKSAGSIGFLSSAEAKVYTDVPGKSKIEQDLSKSKADIWDVHSHLASKLLSSSLPRFQPPPRNG